MKRYALKTDGVTWRERSIPGARRKKRPYRDPELIPMQDPSTQNPITIITATGQRLSMTAVEYKKAKTGRRLMTADEQAIVDRWNTLAGELGLAKIVKMTATRLKHLQARMREKEWDLGKIEQEIRSSRFLLGKNGRGWHVDFDFVINASGYVKILEGKYRNGRLAGGIPPEDGKYEGLAI